MNNSPNLWNSILPAHSYVARESDALSYYFYQRVSFLKLIDVIFAL